MRLTCPNCGAEYDVPDGLVPPDGKHVQCTNCHTRWFMRGGAGLSFSEDEIIRRLETWSPRPRPVAVASAVAAASQPGSGRAARVEPEAVVSEGARPASAGQPRPLPAAPEAGPEPAGSANETDLATAPRDTQRLELRVGDTTPAPAPPARSRFARGLLAAAVLAGLALGVYVWRDRLAANVPAAAPALAGYGATIDDIRGWIERRLNGPRGETAP